jgi:hypothetical protein
LKAANLCLNKGLKPLVRELNGVTSNYIEKRG